MSTAKQYSTINVLDAARERIRFAFDSFERLYVSFSGGKDSTVMLHLVMEEAIARGRRVGILVIDLEAQYAATMAHVQEMLDLYRDHSDQFWVCLPMLLRNAVSQYEPRWCCWDPEAVDAWVRPLPDHPFCVGDVSFFPFFQPRMEFEEFMVLFGLWYGQGQTTAAFVGIRCDESLNRFRSIASSDKTCYAGRRYTTQVEEGLFNLYPIYDWKTSDIWAYHGKTRKPYNRLYDMMHLAGLSIHQMRICQPYGDDQRRGLWLYHLIEPESWFRVVARVNGANSGALYINETGNINGYNRVACPPGHTWKSFCALLLSSLPPATRDHYTAKFKTFIAWWQARGYTDGIPDEVPYVLERQQLAPSYRRLCKVLLRNDWWCKGLSFSQPKSAAYQKYVALKREQCKEGKKRMTTPAPEWRVETMTNQSPGFYNLLGPYFGSRAVAEELGSPIWDDPEKVWILAFDGAALAGFCSYVVGEKSARLASSYVLPSYRGRGIYNMLFARRLSAIPRSLPVKSVATKLSVGTYRRHGFEVVRQRGRFFDVLLRPEIADAAGG